MPCRSWGSRMTLSLAPTSLMISVSARRACRTSVVAVVTVRMAASASTAPTAETDDLEEVLPAREPLDPFRAALDFLGLG